MAVIIFLLSFLGLPAFFFGFGGGINGSIFFHNSSYISQSRPIFRVVITALFLYVIVFLLFGQVLSQEFVIAGTPDASYFQTLATLLLAVREWGGGVFATIVFSLSALILNYILYRSKLIPRWLSGWGLIGATLALQEMVLAVWLIVKGFNSSTIASGSLKTDTKEVK